MSRRNPLRLTASISTSLSKMSGRERLLASAGAALIGGAIVLQAYDVMGVAGAKNLQAHIDLAAAEDAAKPADAEFVRRVRQAEKDVAAWSWAAPSVASGRVSVENSLDEMTRSAGLKDAVVEYTGVTERSGDVYFVRMHVSSRDNMSGLERFGQALEASTKGFLFEKVSFSDAPSEDRLDFDLALPLIVAQNPVK